MRARCYPFNMRGHRFHKLKRQVHSKLIDIQHLYSIYHGMHIEYPMFILVPVLQDTVVIVPLYPFTFVSSPPRSSSLWLPANSAGASPALPPVSGRERDIYYLLQLPPAPTGQIPHGSTDQVQPTQQPGRGAMCTR